MPWEEAMIDPNDLKWLTEQKIRNKVNHLPRFLQISSRVTMLREETVIAPNDLKCLVKQKITNKISDFQNLACLTSFPDVALSWTVGSD